MNKKLLRRSFLKRSAAVCGGAALISHSNIFGSDEKNNSIGDNETLKTIHQLRTIHGNFNDKEIPEDQIQKILKASIRAANSSAMQTYSIIIVKDRAKMKEMCGYQGSCLLLYCVDYNRIKESARFLGYEYYEDNMQGFITGSTNTILAAQTAVIAAKSLGIDSLLTNGIHRGNIERLWKILDLPEEKCLPLIALVLGYPTEEPKYEKQRLDGPGIFHNETYHRLTDEELEMIVKRYYDKDSHIGLIEDWDKQGHKHYLVWLYKTWLRGTDKPTSNETQIFKLLKRSGFVEMQKS